MNAFDKNRKRFTAQCEDCDEVFDILQFAELHRSTENHRIKITEFWVTGKA